MKKLRKILKNESGAAEIIEAAIVYPVVIVAVFTLVYFGMFILQTITVQTYAQKIALLAAREVGRPGYIAMLTKNGTGSVTQNSAELALQDYSQSVNQLNEQGQRSNISISIPTDSKEVRARAYRFWSQQPLKATTNYQAPETLRKMMEDMVDKNSFLVGRGSATAKIECTNHFITQYVTVTVTQPVMSNGLMEFFNIKTPEVEARAMAAATDIDEFVRNTNFVTDTLEMLARKLNIDIDSVKSKLDLAMQKIGLKDGSGGVIDDPEDNQKH